MLAPYLFVFQAAGRLQAAVDEAYAALRDLNCEVQYVKVLENGWVAPVYEEFGKAAMNFNPVWDEEELLGDRVRQQAKAPFAIEDEEGGCCLSVDRNRGGHDHEHTHDH